jgi:hypothetical protein
MCTLSIDEASCICRRRQLCLVLDLVSSQLTQSMQSGLEHSAAGSPAIARAMSEKLSTKPKMLSLLPQDHTLVNSTRFSEVTPDLEIRLRGLLNLPNAAERHLYELPQIQVNLVGAS